MEYDKLTEEQLWANVGDLSSNPNYSSEEKLVLLVKIATALKSKDKLN